MHMPYHECVLIISGYTKSDYVFTRMVLFAYLSGLPSNIGNNAEEYTVSGSRPADQIVPRLKSCAHLTCRSRGTQENMTAWAWPVEGWDAMASNDEFSEEAELVSAAAEQHGVAAAEGDSVEGGSYEEYLRMFGDR